MDPRFAIAASEPGATSEEMDVLRQFSARVGILLPTDLLEILHEATDVEIKVCDLGYIRIWPPAFICEMNVAYGVLEDAPGLIAVADDEGGMLFAIGTGASGFGVYKIMCSYPNVEDAVFVAASFDSLLSTGDGIERLFA
jgi:hypothetical protein